MHTRTPSSIQSLFHFEHSQIHVPTTIPHFPSQFVPWGGLQYNEYWQLKTTPEMKSSQNFSDSCLRANNFTSRCFLSALPTKEPPLHWVPAQILCAFGTAVLSKQKLNLSSCWNGIASIALWRNPSASKQCFWFDFLASKVLDEFTFIIFLLCHQQRKWGTAKSCLPS